MRMTTSYNYTSAIRQKTKYIVPLFNFEINGAGAALVSLLFVVLVMGLCVLVLSFLRVPREFSLLAGIPLGMLILFVFFTEGDDRIEDQGVSRIMAPFYRGGRRKYRMITTHLGERILLGRKRKGDFLCIQRPLRSSRKTSASETVSSTTSTS